MVEIVVQFEVDDRPVTLDEITDEYLAEMLEHRVFMGHKIITNAMRGCRHRHDCSQPRGLDAQTG